VSSIPSPHPNAEVISRFYSAFAQKDHHAMASCYAPSVRFGDPVFTNLDYDRATSMWRMFCETGNDLSISFGSVEADDVRGSATWEASYIFSSSGRRVLNHIDASFEFLDGLITVHRDSFDFYAWTKMALGPVGWALGWTPLLKKKVRRMASGQLDRFIRERSQS
jgi:hypothetical protein